MSQIHFFDVSIFLHFETCFSSCISFQSFFQLRSKFSHLTIDSSGKLVDDIEEFQEAALGLLHADSIGQEIFNMVTGNNILFSVSLYQLEEGKYCSEETKTIFDGMIVEAFNYFAVARAMKVCRNFQSCKILYIVTYCLFLVTHR
jgi:hypothetical protein